MADLVLSDRVAEYVQQRAMFPAVKQKRLQALLEKLAKYGASCRDAPSRDRGDKRRREAEAVGRMYPG